LSATPATHNTNKRLSRSLSLSSLSHQEKKIKNKRGTRETESNQANE